MQWGTTSDRRKAAVLLLLLGICWFGGQNAVLLHAQDQSDGDTDDSDVPMESDWDNYFPDHLYTKGDKTFTMTAGVMFPLFFLNNGALIDHHFSPPVGGVLSMAYTQFLSPHFFMGAEVGLKFNYTLAKNTVFIVPIGLRAGWQFVVSRMEFPVLLVVGVAPQRYLNNSYAGLFVKGGVSAFYRFSPEWSFGINTDWSWYPQWPQENGKPAPEKNVDANILGLKLSARYHF